ncbi:MULTISPECIES: response regulator transcription factor [unclassified Leifsonia]|uniref:response regulator transcription factor n=1 Tax=unclassified Leifsonia TaxID=2663824 RepID=UPI0014815926|nr:MULTISPECIES: response regulator transcription factor [unclassified Leifsonia]
MDDTRIVVVDDHPILREGLVTALERSGRFQVVGVGCTSDEAIRLALEHNPDVLCLDIEMPGPPVGDTIRAVRAQHAEMRIAVLTMYSGGSMTRQLVAAGVDEVLSKTTPTAEVLQRLASIRRQRASDSGPGVLTVRETEVLRLVAHGHGNRTIATILSIAEGTVRRHLANAFDKLHAHSRTEAVRLARLLGYL